MNTLLELIRPLMPHAMLAPIGLPMVTAAILLLVPEERQRVKLALNLFSTTLGLACSVMLLLWLHQGSGSHCVGVYLQGNWQAPFGIVLVLDHLAAMMLVLSSGLALCALLFAGARWHRAGVHFHTLFQFQLMGLAGAFLTADLFNLFVFFEIMLAASYGLLLHGSGRARVQSGLHYIAINLAASSLFLIGASMLYGITGTLNMADLARSIAHISAPDRGLLHAAAAILATAFLIKAAAWPLNFWLVPAYGSATAPVGALFAIMTKVGVYALLRLWVLLFGALAGPSEQFGSSWLICSGLATMAFGAIGMMGSQRLTHLAGHAAVLSSGTLLATTGLGQTQLIAALLYYLPSSTLAVGALFLLADLIDRWRNHGATPMAYEDEEAPFLTPELMPRAGMNLDDDEEVLVGRVIPAAAAFLGVAYLACTLVIAGIPPLSGFIGKFAIFNALLNPLGLGASAHASPSTAGWVLMGLMLCTGLLALLALTRSGIRHFWARQESHVPRLRILEGLPIALLLGACVLLTTHAQGVLRYTEATANALLAPQTYIDAVFAAQPIAAPHRGDEQQKKELPW